mgnify:CR=1 FL=1
MELTMLQKENPFGGFDPELLACAARNAGHLLVAEHFDGGGYSLIWRDQVSGKFAAFAQPFHREGASEYVAFAGYLAEALVSHGSFVHACKTYEASEGAELDAVKAKMVANILRGSWERFEQYTNEALQQWNDSKRRPLSHFMLSKLDSIPEKPLEHHRAAYKKGSSTAASLVQCGGSEFHIPNSALVEEAK